MRVLITGSHGFVGRRFVRHFLEQGATVHGVDNLSSGIPIDQWYFTPTKEFLFAQEDCREWFEYRTAGGFNLIIHCAAVVGGRLKIEGDPLAVATDLAIDSDFFNWVVADKNSLPKKVIYFSSSAVYPTMFQQKQQHCALSEGFVNLNATRVGMPDQTYGFSKLAGEYLAQVAAKKYGLDVVIYRPFSGYGEDQALDYPFPSIIQRVLNKENPLFVWGSGDQQRDFIHIDDVVRAVIITMDKLKPGQVLNLGSGKGTSFFQLAQMAALQAGYTPLIKTMPDKPEGVFARVAETYSMNQYYLPRISLPEGIKRSLAFQSGLDLDKKAV